ncbi:DUF3037 domain-containing protein [Pantoea sp. EEL5]|uniref:DUF3037 domain-containing protein n=1 Tax=Pantoea sp. EEL5 TaxID=3416806 RepID=UPI003CF03A21
MKTFKYSLIRVTPNLEKGETINVGMIVYDGNEIDVRMISSVSKLKAIDKCLDINYLDDLTNSLNELANALDDVYLLPKLFKGSLSLSDFGIFTIDNNSNYDKKINELMNRLVNPHKKPYKRAHRKVFFDIKETFIQHGIFSKYDEDLFNHKVVANYPISDEEGLRADFLLKNGAYHLTEAIDFRSENMKKQMGEAALSALTISKAQEIFCGNIKSFVIYAAETITQEMSAKQQLTLLEKHSDNLINAFSKEDMSQYYEHIMNAASTLQ